jgi:hypothetical protein
VGEEGIGEQWASEDWAANELGWELRYLEFSWSFVVVESFSPSTHTMNRR